MSFGDKLRELRLEQNLTQEELAKKIGVSHKTVSRYEKNETRPRYRKIYDKIAEVLGTTHNYLVTDEESFVLDAKEQFGTRGAKQAEQLVNDMVGLMAGDEVPDEDKRAILEAIQEAYYISKHENKKYTPKKYLKDD